MYFDSLNEFLAMGGHGLYVWMSYGLFVLVLAWNFFSLRKNRLQSIKRAQKTWKREELSKKTESHLNQKKNSVMEL